MLNIKRKNFTIYLDGEDIFVCRFSDDITIEVKDVEEVIKQYDVLINEGKELKTLYIFPKKTRLSSDARIATEVNERPALAKAFVLQNISHRVLFKFYKLARSRSWPIREFSDEEEALRWLRKI